MPAKMCIRDRVKILNPDEKLVIGFDVDIKVNTEKITNVLKIPVDPDAAARQQAETRICELQRENEEMGQLHACLLYTSRCV